MTRYKGISATLGILLEDEKVKQHEILIADPKREEKLLCNNKKKTIIAKVRKCKICGCSQTNACIGGCYWVSKDLCSRCIYIETNIS